MSPVARRLLFWTPRVLGIAFALFISIFAMDVFNEHYRLPQLLVALGMHLIPTSLIVLALTVAWRWEWVGAVLFFGLGVAYIVWMWGRFPWDHRRALRRAGLPRRVALPVRRALRAELRPRA